MQLFVGNLSFKATEADLKDFFGQYGAVSKVTIPVDRDTGKVRGFAFVEVDAGPGVIEATNGTRLLGRELRVSMAERRR